MNKRYLLVLPAFNQMDRISEIICEAKKFDVEILAIDDGSTDDTGQILSGIKEINKIYNKNNLGYGQTLINSFQYGIKNGYDFLITMDTDGQHLPAEIPAFIKEAPNWDIVSGSRYLNNTVRDSNVPQDRYDINKKITLKINEITKFNITDSFCGFKAYSVNSLKKLSIDEPGYGMPLQLWIQAWKHGFRIKEIPVRRIYKDFTKRFGAGLHNAEVRLKYYNSIIENELDRLYVKN